MPPTDTSSQASLALDARAMLFFASEGAAITETAAERWCGGQGNNHRALALKAPGC